MNYLRIYNNIVSKNYQDFNQYLETHHIIPKCLGGSDEKSNLVKLPLKAHFISHLLLCKIYPNEPKLFYAFNMMMVSNKYQKRRRITSRLYSKIKKELYSMHSTYMTNTIFIYNIKTKETKRIFKADKIPVGWSIGLGKSNTKNKIRYYNSVTDTEIMLDKNLTQIPHGFTKGRRPFKQLFSIDGQIQWDKGQQYDPTIWFREPVVNIAYINIKTGKKIILKNIDQVPPGFIQNTMDEERKLTCKHFITKETGILTLKEYNENVYWLRPNLKQNVLYNTDIGIVRCKEDYYRKTGRFLNIKKYCNQNTELVSSWLVNRSKLPASWINKPWKDLGFGIIRSLS